MPSMAARVQGTISAGRSSGLHHRHSTHRSGSRTCGVPDQVRARKKTPIRGRADGESTMWTRWTSSTSPDLTISPASSRRSEELRGQAQIPGADPGLLAPFPQRRRQKRPVVLDMAAGDERQPSAPVADVQHASITVDDDRAAGDVAGQRGTTARVVDTVQDGQQPGQSLPLIRTPVQIRLGGRTNVGTGGRHVITSG